MQFISESTAPRQKQLSEGVNGYVYSAARCLDVCIGVLVLLVR
jgi:hypothetical protein